MDARLPRREHAGFGLRPRAEPDPHTYAAAGTYHPVLSVTDSSNATRTATVTITVNPQPSITLSGVSVTEGDSGTTPAVFAVTLSAVSTHDVTVDYATADGTARAGADYNAAQGTLPIPAGTTCPSSPACKIPVQVIGDKL